MKVEIPKNIRDLLTDSQPATLSTQVPMGANFDGEPEEIAVEGQVEIWWDCASPPEGSLRFRFTVDCHTEIKLLTRFNEYYNWRKGLAAEQGPGFPLGHVVLTIHDSRSKANERGAGYCNGLPQFERDDGKWIMEDPLEGLWCAASELDGRMPAKLVAISLDPNLGRLAERLGGNVRLGNIGTLAIGRAAIADYLTTLFGAVPASAGLAPPPEPRDRITSEATVAVDSLYRVELVVPTPPKGVGAEAFASTLFAALSFASGWYVDFAGAVIVQGGRAIFSEMKPMQGRAPKPFCPPIGWTNGGESGNAPAPAVADYKMTVAKVASLFFRRMAADIPLIGSGPRLLYTHPLVHAITELRHALCADIGGDPYLTMKRAYTILPAAIEMIAKCYELKASGEASGKVSWSLLKVSDDGRAKNDRIKKLIGDNAFKFWSRIRNPLAHELRLMEDGPQDTASVGPHGNHTMREFLSEHGQEVNARCRDLWKVQRFLLTMFNHVILRIIGYTGDATNWADKNECSYCVGGGNAPTPQATDFETKFAGDNWG